MLPLEPKVHRCMSILGTYLTYIQYLHVVIKTNEIPMSNLQAWLKAIFYIPNTSKRPFKIIVKNYPFCFSHQPVIPRLFPVTWGAPHASEHSGT